MPKEVMPPEWTEPGTEEQATQPKSQEIFNELKGIRDEFMESMK